MQPAFLSVILSEVAAATESKDPYSCKNHSNKVGIGDSGR